MLRNDDKDAPGTLVGAKVNQGRVISSLLSVLRGLPIRYCPSIECRSMHIKVFLEVDMD